LLVRIKTEVHTRLDIAESDVVVNARTKDLLAEAAEELCRGAMLAPKGVCNTPLQSWDIFAEHVRRAADCIGRILGVIGADEIADAVFSQLCLGK